MHQITAYGGLKGKVPFQQAIPQSPGFQPVPGAIQQEAIFAKTLKSASQITGRNISTLRQLRNLSASDLYYTNCLAIADPGYGLFEYGPVVDGKFAPRLPGELLLTGQFDKNLNLMIGHNADEGLLFSSPYIQNNTDFSNYVSSAFPSAPKTAVDHITNKLYPPIFDGSHGYTSQIRRTDLFFSELAFTCNTRYMALAFGNETFSYLFSVPPALHGDDSQYSKYLIPSSNKQPFSKTCQNSSLFQRKLIHTGLWRPHQFDFGKYHTRIFHKLCNNREPQSPKTALLVGIWLKLIGAELDQRWCSAGD
jgi:carboxylesterase type B